MITLTTNAITQGEIVNVTEGDSINFDCVYDDAALSGSQSIFILNGKDTIKPQVIRSEISYLVNCICSGCYVLFQGIAIFFAGG